MSASRARGGCIAGDTQGGTARSSVARSRASTYRPPVSTPSPAGGASPRPLPAAQGRHSCTRHGIDAGRQAVHREHGMGVRCAAGRRARGHACGMPATAAIFASCSEYQSCALLSRMNCAWAGRGPGRREACRTNAVHGEPNMRPACVTSPQRCVRTLLPTAAQPARGQPRRQQLWQQPRRQQLWQQAWQQQRPSTRCAHLRVAGVLGLPLQLLAGGRVGHALPLDRALQRGWVGGWVEAT